MFYRLFTTTSLGFKKLSWAFAAILLAIASVTPQSLSQSTADPSLVSPETQVDYTPLRNLLTQQQWYKANEKTRELMLRAAGRETQGWMSIQNVQEFPCWDLKTIDRLWQESSQGLFGFSVQFLIFVSTGNKPGKLLSIESYEEFGDRVGWREQGQWIGFKENLTYSLDAPTGHLPNPRQEYQITGGRLEYTTLAQRMVSCQVVSSF